MGGGSRCKESERDSDIKDLPGGPLRAGPVTTSLTLSSEKTNADAKSFLWKILSTTFRVSAFTLGSIRPRQVFNAKRRRSSRGSFCDRPHPPLLWLAAF